jgi:hypothetical protein
MLLFGSILGLAKAESITWVDYAECVAATAVAMPVTYALGETLTGTSNQLVSGMLPAVLTGIVLPSSVAVGSASLISTKRGMELDSSAVFGQTIGLNVGVYTAGTVMGISTDLWQDRFVYGALSALLLPLPSMISMRSPNSTASLRVSPAENDGWTMNAMFQHRF